MAQEERFSSLFDMASKKQKKKQEEPARPEIPTTFPAGQDLKVEFERCKEMYQEIKNKIENNLENSKQLID